MNYILTEDESLLRDSASQFIDKEAPVSSFRELRDAKISNGYSEKIWKNMADMGWPSILVPEEFGGLGLGMREFAQILECCGKNLCQSPLISDSVVATHLILNSKNEKAIHDYLGGLMNGSSRVVLAYLEESTNYEPEACDTIAMKNDNGYIVTGIKTFVAYAYGSDAFLINAKIVSDKSHENTQGLFLIPADSAGVTLDRQVLMDGQVCARMIIDRVSVPAEGQLFADKDASKALTEAIDLGTAALCAEMLGGMRSAFEMAIEYLCIREQFGQKIGSFQALQHRASRLYTELELADSAVRAACCAIDDGKADKQRMVSLAKVVCSESYINITCEALQFFGGIGMTDEHNIGLYLKKARVSEQFYGDPDWHRCRWATLSGY